MAAIVAGAAFASAGTLPFVPNPVYTSQDLVTQINGSFKIRDLYEVHFGMEGKELVEYIGSLRASTLAEDGLYTVYTRPDTDGSAKLLFLKKGEPVLVDDSGTPTILMENGAPMSLSTAVRDLTPTAATGKSNAGLDLSTELEIADVKSFAISQDPATVGTGGAAISGASAAVAIGLAAGVVVLANNDSDTTRLAEVVPVPEPASACVLLGGIAAAGMARRRAKKA